MRDFVRRLHPGQVAILGLIAALALGLLLQTRQHATVEKQRNESLAHLKKLRDASEANKRVKLAAQTSGGKPGDG